MIDFGRAEKVNGKEGILKKAAEKAELLLQLDLDPGLETG